MGRYSILENKDGAGKFYGKLNNIEKQLVDSKIPFLRIHQSYLVNYRFICKISFSHVAYLQSGAYGLHLFDSIMKI